MSTKTWPAAAQVPVRPAPVSSPSAPCISSDVGEHGICASQQSSLPQSRYSSWHSGLRQSGDEPGNGKITSCAKRAAISARSSFAGGRQAHRVSVLPLREPRICKSCAQERPRVERWRRGELMSGKEKQTQERVARADLVIADNGHVLTGYFPGDVDPPALPDCCLRVVRRYVHDPASIRAPAGCADGERRSQTDHDQHRNEKISGHGEIPSFGTE